MRSVYNAETMQNKTSFSFPQELPKGLPQIIVIILLVAGAYMLGSLQAKVSLLEKGVGTAPTAAGAGAAPAPAAPAQPLTADDVPPVSDSDKVKGSRDAKVALIEYSDLECPFCKTFHATAQQIVDEYDGQVMWVWRHYPLSFHVNAQKEAEAAECANELGGETAFWEYIDTMMARTTSNGTGFALDKLVPLAGEIGLNESRFQQCLDSGKYAQAVQDEMDGGTQAGVTGTPGNILINMETGETRLIPGALPFEQIKPEIDQMLES